MTRRNAITEVHITRDPCPVITHFFGVYLLQQAAAAGIDTRGLAPHPLPGSEDQADPPPTPRAS